MPKSSKKVGTTKSLDEQREEKQFQLNKELERIREPRVKIHSFWSGKVLKLGKM